MGTASISAAAGLAKDPVELSPMEETFQSLTEQVDLLEDEVARLTCKTAPIRIDTVTDGTKKESVDGPAQSQMRRGLDNLSYRVRNARLQIQTIIAEMEI